MALFAFIKTFYLLSPILLSFLLLLLSLAVNPVISRMRALTGGRKIPTGLVVVGLIAATDADLDCLAGIALNENPSVDEARCIFRIA